MRISSVEFDCPIPLNAVFVSDMREIGVPLYVGIKTCHDHYHIGVLKFTGKGEDTVGVDIDGDEAPEKFASVSDAVAALAQIIEDEQPGIQFDEIPFTLIIDVNTDAIAMALKADLDEREMFGGMADFDPTNSAWLN